MLYSADLILARLPTNAAAKLQDLRDRRDDEMAAERGRGEKIRALVDRKVKAERMRTDLISGMYGTRHAENAPPVLTAAADIASLAAEITRLRALHDRGSETAQECGRLVVQLEYWVAGFPATARLAPNVRREVNLLKGESAIDAVERVRRRLRELEADVLQVHAAPRPAGECKRIIREQIERLAAKCRPDVGPTLDHGEEVIFPTIELQFGTRIEQQVDALGLVAWVCKDRLIAALEREVDELSDEKAALSDKERAERLETLARDVLANNRSEESYIQSAEKSGARVFRRSDADPRAVLELLMD